jgi:RecA-family ATPase
VAGKGTIPLGIPALIAAMGGLGKSYLALDLALQIAAGVAASNSRN